MELQLNFGIGVMKKQSSLSEMVVKVLLCRLTRSPTSAMGPVGEFTWIRTCIFLKCYIKPSFKSQPSHFFFLSTVFRKSVEG